VLQTTFHDTSFIQHNSQFKIELITGKQLLPFIAIRIIFIEIAPEQIAQVEIFAKLREFLFRYNSEFIFN